MLRFAFGSRWPGATIDDRRKASLMLRFMAVIWLLGGTVVAAPYLSDGYPIVTLWMWGHFTAMSLWPLVLRISGRIEVAAHYFSATLCVMLIGCIWLTGGPRSPFFISIPVLVLSSFMTGGARVGRVWASLAVASLLGFMIYDRAVAPIAGVVPADLAAARRLIVPIPVAIAVLALTSVFERARARAFAASHAAQQRAERALAATRLILENTGQGFVYVDPAGKIVGDSSRIAREWLGPIQSGEHLGDLLGRSVPEVADMLVITWHQIVDGLLPLELCIDMLPKRAVIGERHLELAYRPILEAGALAGVVVIFTDVSEHVAREQAENRERDLMSAFRKLTDGRRLFLDFVTDTSQLVDVLAGLPDQREPTDTDELIRLHTLKGNAAVYGLSGFSGLCHELESQVVERAAPLTQDERHQLRSTWDGFLADVQPFLGATGSDVIQLDPPTYEQHLQRIESAVGHDQLAREVRLWSLEPIGQRLAVLADSARALAGRLGKGDIEVRASDDDLRIDPAPLQRLWSNLVHVVRNCVDHGLERPDVRRAKGKSVAGVLTLAVSDAQGGLIIEIGDDGAGIDWDRVIARARAAGQPCETQDQRVAALCHAGVTTRDEVTATSGRGMGMSAVRTAILELGGTMEIETERGKGTTFRFRLPPGLVASGRLPKWSRAARGSNTVIDVEPGTKSAPNEPEPSRSHA